MDQSLTTTGGTDGNTVQTGPDQKTQTISETSIPMREVDSHYVDRDVKLPRDKKGHKSMLIAGIIIGIVLCAIAGALIWFFACYNNPDKVALDAVENFFKADNVVLQGQVSLVQNNDYYDLRSVVLDFDSSSTSLPNSTNVEVAFEFKDRKINLKLGTVQMRDGVIYLQIGNIMESINQLDIDQDTREEMSAVFEVLEVIDNEWWRISVPEMIDEMKIDMELDDDHVKALKDIYSCAIDRINGEVSPELAQVYRNHRFIEVKSVDSYPDGHKPSNWNNLYSVSLNRAELAGFINALPETETAEEFYACYNRVIDAKSDAVAYSPNTGLSRPETISEKYGIEPLSAEDFPEISADDVPSFDDFDIYLEVSLFGHKLNSVNVYCDDDDIDFTATLNFTYQPVAVAAPESYRPITELFEELGELIGEIWAAYDDGYYPDDYPEYTLDDCFEVDDEWICPMTNDAVEV